MINIFIDEHLDMLHCLVNCQVEFLLVGGYAVVHYGYPRTTGDMDIWLNTGNKNRDKLICALQEFGINDADLNTLRGINFEQPVPVFYFGKEPKKIDFITKIANVNFKEAYQQAKHFQINEVAIPIIHLNHLILSKTNTNRLKDKADIEELQRINKYRT